jgi:predicted Fe-Mo cluster-binding NifX family protein
MENQAEKYRFEIYLDEQDLTRKCHRIQGMGVDVLICSAVSKPFARLLEVAGIQVIPEISGKTEEVLDAYVKGDLIQGRFSMPGYRRKDRHAKQGRASPPRKQNGK